MSNKYFSVTDGWRITFNHDFLCGLPSIPQTINQGRQNQYANKINIQTPEEEYCGKEDQETEMPDGIVIIGFEFLAHGKDHSTAEQANHPLDNHKSSIGYSIFSKVPWLKINKKDIGFAQDARAEYNQRGLQPDGP